MIKVNSMCSDMAVVGYFLIFYQCADEEFDQGRISTRTSQTKHRFLKRELEISRGDIAQVWQMGS